MNYPHKHPNFKLEDSERYALVKCPECHQENHALNVLSGVCTWCGFDINNIDFDNDLNKIKKNYKTTINNLSDK